MPIVYSSRLMPWTPSHGPPWIAGWMKSDERTVAVAVGQFSSKRPRCSAVSTATDCCCWSICCSVAHPDAIAIAAAIAARWGAFDMDLSSPPMGPGARGGRQGIRCAFDLRTGPLVRRAPAERLGDRVVEVALLLHAVEERRARAGGVDGDVRARVRLARERHGG